MDLYITTFPYTRGTFNLIASNILEIQRQVYPVTEYKFVPKIIYIGIFIISDALLLLMLHFIRTAYF
jgi:hypothetical protein